METRKLFVKYLMIYFFLILGFVYLYVIDIERIIFPVSEETIESTVDFVYQQF
ncbi:MAG: hypothetical protein JNJ99_01920 [Crocinitomicaceae bacterium]|nr:hypothetical protein [Crocinitomicaceae bacterium]